ncbi:MAG: stalk domain-containing protein, partial [Sporomusa sp.]
MDEKQERSEERRKPRNAAPGNGAEKLKPKKRPDNTDGEQRRKKKRPAESEGRRRTTDSEAPRRTAESKGRRRTAESEGRRRTAESEGRRRTTDSSQRRRTSSDTSARPTDNQRIRSGQERPPVRAVKKKKRSYGPIIVIILLLIAAIGAGAFLWMRYGPSNEEADLEEYYGIENENQLAIIVNNEVLGAQGMIADGTAYVNYETVRDYINSRFYWDSNENVLLYTLPADMISVSVGSYEFTVSKNKQSKDYVILKTDGSQAYIALEFVKEHTDLDYSIYKEPNRAMIETETGETTVATVKSDSQVRRLAG